MKLLLSILLFALVFDSVQAEDRVLEEYATATPVGFVLWKPDGTELKTDAVDGGTDCSISKDGGTETTCTNDFVDEGSGYSISLTATELTAKRVRVCFIDTGTKAYLDKCVFIETYGNASSQHPDAKVTVEAIDDGVITSGTIATDAIGAAELAQGAADKVWNTTSRALTDKSGFALSSSQAFNLTGNITGNLSGSVGSVTTVSDKSGYSAACTLGTDAITSASLSAAAGAKIADITWRRTTAHIEASSDGDTLSAKSGYGVIAALKHAHSVVGNVYTSYKSDGSTQLETRTVAGSSSAVPITSMSN